jgi:hypothetical protein
MVVRAKVIAATLGAFLIAFLAELLGVGEDEARRAVEESEPLQAIIEGYIAALGAFVAGYMKRETREGNGIR